MYNLNSKAALNIRPFKIEIAQSVLDDLQARLKRTRWPDTIPDSGWEYGSDLSYMKELVEYWLTQFDWRAQEKELNRFHHFKAAINGLEIHFIHEKSGKPNSVPLLLTHGWPGSFVEMLKIIPMLTDPEKYGGDPEDAFDVIVPSIIGYGFSSRPSERGFNTFKIADAWAKLMSGLGYEKFGAHGGDIGANVSTLLGYRYPERTIGIHLNYIPGSYAPYLGPEVRALSSAEGQFLKEADEWYKDEGGYAHIQRTKPQTLSYGLNDSPAGLAAWIVEKFRKWADCDGDVERCFSKDELLLNISIYWFTETVHASTRLYFEGSRAPVKFNKDEGVKVPVGIAHFPFESPFPPRAWIERGYHILHWTDMPSGGHFAAWEEPELLAKDIRTFFKSLGA